ncbi:hypothetical protein [Rhizobium mesoamericanum]|uniref:hypothetical protein n=1 Tax=Rhizobium mesoamericanum TaxID=1079800 RepID=UPI00040BA206|nr:hypothetical protein [Rhizobium mesoamericanum]
MNRYLVFMVVGALVTLATIISACTSTAYQNDRNRPLNLPCEQGFGGDRPCSY